MANLKKIARRTFIIGSASVAGGLIVGYTAYKWPLGNPLLDTLDEGESALTPFLRIDRNGITIITPRADVGQGAYSVQAALVAEELDLEWGDFRVDPGPPSPAYYNSTALAEALPVRGYRDGLGQSLAATLGDAAAKILGQQITGGSSTVPDGYLRLRRAGAAAREMLLETAAREHEVERSALRTRRGHVVLPDGRELPYTTLAAAAATLSVPSDPPLKNPADWRLLGKPMQRLDVVAKSTGRAVFGIDIRLDGMVYATVRANPAHGSGLRNVDPAPAQGMRGVIKVVPLDDAVAVLADNTWRAFRAAAALNPEWEPANYPASTEEHFAAAVASLDARRNSRLRNDGNVNDAWEQAAADATKVEAEYRVPYLAHAALEPVNAVAQLVDGELHLWTGTQVPRVAVSVAAKAAGIDEDRVQLHVLISGGSFGRRLESDWVAHAAAIAAAHPGPPIKLTYTREEDMARDMPRPLGVARGRGVATSGQVQSFELAVAGPSVAASQAGRVGLMLPPGPDPILVRGAFDQPYGIPHYRVSGHVTPGLPPVSSWRSVGASGNCFFHESLLDELIHAAGADPLAERIRLCVHEPSRRVLEAAGELGEWSAPTAAGRGRGVAFSYAFNVPCACVVEVEAGEGGLRVLRVAVVAEVGKVLDPVNLDAQLSGGVLFGLGHAMFGEFTYANGAAQQRNFGAYQSLRIQQTPTVVTRALELRDGITGAGEVAVPPAAPALANAIFAATGQRIRELPLSKHLRFA